MKAWPWKIIVVSFVTGVLLGVAVGLRAPGPFRPRWNDRGADKLVDRLDRELHLTTVQRQKIVTILDLYRDRMKGHREEIRRAVKADIRAELTPDQQTRFDAMEARREAKRLKHRGW